MSSHRVSELVLAKVPHLSDTTLWFNKKTAKTVGTAASEAFHAGSDQSSDDISFQFQLVESEWLKYEARIVFVLKEKWNLPLLRLLTDRVQPPRSEMSAASYMQESLSTCLQLPQLPDSTD